MGEFIRLDVSELAQALDALGLNVAEAVRRAAVLSVESMIADVVRERMSGQLLGVVTGTARRSMAGLTGGGSTPGAAAMENAAKARSTVSPTRVTSEWGSPLAYVRAHEEGFHGMVGVRAHVRRRARTARAWSIETHRGTVFGRRPKGVVYVTGHAMRMNVRAKRFMAATVAAKAPSVSDRVWAALRILARTGRIPTYAQLGA